MRREELTQHEIQRHQPGQHGQPDDERALALARHRHQPGDSGGQPAQQHPQTVEGQQRLPPRRRYSRGHEHRRIEQVEHDEDDRHHDGPPSLACAG
jgi:hypothetical protein